MASRRCFVLPIAFDSHHVLQAVGNETGKLVFVEPDEHLDEFELRVMELLIGADG